MKTESEKHRESQIELAFKSGKLEATEAHLKDLQRIIFDKKPTEGKIVIEGDYSGSINNLKE